MNVFSTLSFEKRSAEEKVLTGRSDNESVRVGAGNGQVEKAIHKKLISSSTYEVSLQVRQSLVIKACFQNRFIGAQIATQQ